VVIHAYCFCEPTFIEIGYSEVTHFYDKGCVNLNKKCFQQFIDLYKFNFFFIDKFNFYFSNLQLIFILRIQTCSHK
jgi:hypothetical protein